mgnify:FL=1
MAKNAGPFNAATVSNLPRKTREWLRMLKAQTAAGSGILFSGLDFTASNLTSLVTRAHNNLQSIDGGTSGQYYHLTLAQHTPVVAAFAVGTKCDGYVRKAPAEIQTTDATQTTVDSLTLLDENTYHIKAWVIGVRSTGAARASYEISCTAYRTGAGVATLEGAVTTIHSRESNATWGATFTVSGNDVRVSVTGAVMTIQWVSLISYINMSN